MKNWFLKPCICFSYIFVIFLGFAINQISFWGYTCALSLEMPCKHAKRPSKHNFKQGNPVTHNRMINIWIAVHLKYSYILKKVVSALQLFLIYFIQTQDFKRLLHHLAAEMKLNDKFVVCVPPGAASWPGVSFGAFSRRRRHERQCKTQSRSRK